MIIAPIPKRITIPEGTPAVIIAAHRGARKGQRGLILGEVRRRVYAFAYRRIVQSNGYEWAEWRLEEVQAHRLAILPADLPEVTP